MLDSELTDGYSHLFVNRINLGSTGYDYNQLSADAKRMACTDTAGGSSLLSEVISLETLAQCEGAVLRKTETEICYTNPSGMKTDYLADIGGVQVGVSVTRAHKFLPVGDDYTVAEAASLLNNKLEDIPLSSANVRAPDVWTKQILSVITSSDQAAGCVETAWNQLDSDTKGDSILLVTITDGNDTFIYEGTNADACGGTELMPIFCE